jgi:hypothetical protein
MSAAVVAPERSASVWDQVHRLVRWLKLIVYGTVGFFALLVVTETAHVYRLASDVSPWLGYVWLGVVLGGFILVGVPAYRFLQMPRVVQPPRLPTADELRPEHIKSEVRYLEAYLDNCARNSELADKREEIGRARRELADLGRRLGQVPANQVAVAGRELGEWSARVFRNLLGDLDRKAERVIYQESLAVGLATAASPNGTLDAFVMLWRSVNLVARLATLYYGRPGVWGTLAVCRDVSMATAMAGYMQNISESLGNLVAKSIGGVTGVVAGPAIDGATNALVLIRIGYLAQERCRSFRQWDTATRGSALVSALTATQRVAVGLTTEILRQVGSGLTAAASVAATGVAQAAAGAVNRISTVAESALQAAVGFGQSLASALKPKNEENQR